jgi:predicted MFS family arabinose efflux permease
VLAALHLRDPRPDALAALDDREWRHTLEFCYHSRLALPLRAAARDFLPEWVRQQLDHDARQNLERLDKLRELYRALDERFTARGISYAALKGIAQCPLFGADPEERVQYDIDLYVPSDSIDAAWQSLREWGYEPQAGTEKLPTDHLPALVRKTGWEFRGDYFDPELPYAIELHFQFWNYDQERLPAPGTEDFWARHEWRRIAGLDLPVLARADALGYASLHALRHWLLGSLSVSHVYEIARFLDRHAADDAFWREWSALHAPELRRLEALTFRLAESWFGCELASAAAEEIERLPGPVQSWFDEFAWSPISQRFHPNKDELWLHFSLLDSRRDIWSVARRRLLPMTLPGSAGMRTGTWLAYVAERFRHHALAFPEVIATGARWWLGREFWWFLASAVLFNLALFVFVLLYNLHLLDLGYKEGFLGTVAGAATVGTFAGTLPAALVVRRIGLRATLVSVCGIIAALIPLRTLLTGRISLVVLSVVWGLAFAAWAVVIAPAIAAAVPERRRATAFSVFFASMFAVGIAGNWIGGRLPDWLHGKSPALLLSAFVVAAAIWPATRLRASAPAPEQAKTYPRGAWLWRYLAVFAIWNLATATFNPFANVYFKRLQFSDAHIGSTLAAAQAVQVIAVLLAPLVFRRIGLVAGIVVMMAATGLGLAGLAQRPAGEWAAMAFAAYMSFQWMSEPGLNTLLMNHVEERERSGAAAMNHFVAFCMQAGAAFAAGALLDRFGYGPVLAGAALLAGAAAALFRIFITS